MKLEVTVSSSFGSQLNERVLSDMNISLRAELKVVSLPSSYGMALSQTMRPLRASRCFPFSNKAKFCHFNPLKTKRRLFYLKTQFVPPCKHFSSRL